MKFSFSSIIVVHLIKNIQHFGALLEEDWSFKLFHSS